MRLGKGVQVADFWKDVFVAGGQVTFGVVAATWFVLPFDGTKTVVLFVNGLSTVVFLVLGLVYAKRI